MDNNYPQKVDDAVNLLLTDMSLNDEIQISLMNKEDLINLHYSLGSKIRKELGLWSGNIALMESCRKISGDPNLHVDSASMLIIMSLWKKLKSSNVLNSED